MTNVITNSDSLIIGNVAYKKLKLLYTTATISDANWCVLSGIALTANGVRSLYNSYGFELYAHIFAGRLGCSKSNLNVFFWPMNSRPVGKIARTTNPAQKETTKNHDLTTVYISSKTDSKGPQGCGAPLKNILE